jgi:ABC-type transport system involved in multi-copper enzyme maturation permease subunit
MFSAFYSDRGKAVFTVVGILIFSYALDVLANFNDFIEKLDFLSLFKYYDPYPYISTASIDWSDLAVYAGIIIITSTVAIIRFQRRDIAV